jgi:hypothetical protein
VRHLRRFANPTVISTFLASLTFSSLDAKVGSSWIDLPPLSTPRQEVGVTSDGLRVYVIGGILADRSATGIVDRFDIGAGEWQSVPPLPDGLRVHHVGAASARGLVFAIGGLDASFRGTRDVHAFDPAKGAWERRADLPSRRGAMGVAAIEEKIYAAGGQDGSTSFADFAVYDVLEDRWETLPAMPTARNHLAAAVVDGIFHAVGGRAESLFGTLEAYDPATRRWVELAPMPTARGGIAAAALRGCIFVFGGEGNPDDPGGVFRQVEGYDACKNVWMPDLDMPHPRHGTGAAEVNGLIYLPGGSPTEGFGVTDTVDAFAPGSRGSGFIRGDSNLDGRLDVSDAVFSLAALFLGGDPFRCEDAADTNDSGRIDISDPIFGLTYLFQGGPSPPAPGPELPGADLTDDALSCIETPLPHCFEPF